MRLWIAVLLLGAGSTALAQPPARPCAGPEHRQFDFWIGEWSVTGAAGQHAGDNTIKAVAGTCALSESWRGAKGGEGFSYSAYDSLRKTWHQTWVDKDGLVLLLDGGLQDGKMVLSGMTGTTLNRVSWEPRKDGTVRQLWETSADQGKTWQTAFDGLYRRKST
jgi:hypothetical protein